MDRAKLEALEKLLAMATPGEFSVHVRSDGSVYVSVGDYRTGPHEQGDVHLSPENVAAMVAAINALPALLRLARAVVDAPEVSFYADCNMIGVIGPDWADEKSLLQGTYLLLRADAADTTAGEGNA